MKIKEGFVLRSLGDEFIITGEGPAQVNFNKMISLNGSAAYLWNSVQGKDFVAEDLANLLLAEYDVDEKTASRDAAAIVEKWSKIGLLSE